MKNTHTHARTHRHTDTQAVGQADGPGTGSGGGGAGRRAQRGAEHRRGASHTCAAAEAAHKPGIASGLRQAGNAPLHGSGKRTKTDIHTGAGMLLIQWLGHDL